MFIPDPDFYPSRIPDPGSKNSNKRERWKKISCHTFLCSHKFHKILNYFSFEVLKKKIWANFQRIIELFTQKTVKKLLKIWSWDPGSEIRDSEKTYSGSRIPDPGVKKAPDPGSGSATLHNICFEYIRRQKFVKFLVISTGNGKLRSELWIRIRWDLEYFSHVRSPDPRKNPTFFSFYIEKEICKIFVK